MARTKSWAESQQPENQYSYGQYVFNSVVVGLAIVALVVFLAYILRPKPSPETQLLVVHPKSDSQWIPYLANDTTQLKNALSISAADIIRFDDKQNFETQVPNRVRELQNEAKEIDTMVVYCTAIGDVIDSKPVLRSADGTETISVEKLLNESVAASKAANRIVVLDCGFAYARPQSYLEVDFSMGDDFNRFADKVDMLLRQLNTDDEKPIWVITSTQAGEVPLYSVNQRRTLFSLAMQNTLGRSSEDSKSSFENVSEFYQALVEFCHQHGGEAAPTPLLFQSGVGKAETQVTPNGSPTRIARFPLAQSREPENGAKAESTPNQDPATKLELDKLTNLWKRRDTIREKYVPRRQPVVFATGEWDKSVLEIAEQSIEMRKGQGSISSNPSIDQFAEGRWINQAAEVKYISDNPEALSTAEREAHDIAAAYATYYEAVYRAKYYGALFDSLSWIDASEALNRFEQKLVELNDAILESKPLFQSKVASKNDKSNYDEASRRLKNGDNELMNRVANICEHVNDLHGMTRELAITNLLDSPLIATNKTEDTRSDTRTRLLERLLTDGAGSFVRLTKDSRLNNSKLRRNLYFGHMKEFCTSPDPVTIENRNLDAIAYYFSLGDSHLRSLDIRERAKTYWAKMNQAKLRNGFVVEAGLQNPRPTEIDLELDANTDGGLVDLSCKLEQPDAPFVIVDPKNPSNVGKAIDIKGSNGKFYVYAEKIVRAGDAIQTYSLAVQIKQSFNGVDLSDKQTPVTIPLALPNENRVDLIVKLHEKQEQQIQPDAQVKLSPWPNRDTPFSVAVVNHWHRPRRLQATLYPCVTEEDYPIFPGKIDDTIQRNTLRRLDIGSLPMVARSKIVEVEAANAGQFSPRQTFVLSTKTPETDPSIPVPKLHEPGTGFTNGVLCRVEDLETDDSWNYWLSVFPDTSDLCDLTPRDEANHLWLEFSCAKELENRPLKIDWRLGAASGSKELTNSGREELGEDLSLILETFHQQQSTPILYIDVEGWPRRYAFIHNGLEFINPNTVANRVFPNAAFSELSLDGNKPEPSPFRDVQNVSAKKGLAKVVGVQGPKPDFIWGTLQINCVINAEQFSFDGPQDVFEIEYGGIKKVYYFPRHVESSLSQNPDTGIWILKSTVTDFVEKREVTGNPFDIDPIGFVFNGSQRKLGDDIVRIIFDNTDPPPPILDISTKQVYPGDEVQFRVRRKNDNPGGVGIDNAAVQYQINEMPPQTARLSQEYNDRYGFAAPKETSEYRLRVHIVDQLGNASDHVEGFFSVVAKPEPRPDENKQPQPPLHKLVVKVKVAGNPLAEDQNPELKIEPPDATPERKGDTFVFGGLKGGVKYTITSEYKLTTGFKPEVAGKITYTFDKDERGQITKEMVLNLERK